MFAKPLGHSELWQNSVLASHIGPLKHPWSTKNPKTCFQASEFSGAEWNGVKAERFCDVIKIRGINPYVCVEAEVANRLKAGWRKPMPVLIRINGQPRKPWRINLMPKGDGSFYLYLHASVRRASATKVGDRVIVEVSFDKKYRTGVGYAIPVWFNVALRDNRRAKEAWKMLVPSRKKEILRYFSALKSAEARDRNLKRALQVLSGTEARFMARTWKNGK